MRGAWDALKAKCRILHRAEPHRWPPVAPTANPTVPPFDSPRPVRRRGVFHSEIRSLPRTEKIGPGYAFASSKVFDARPTLLRSATIKPQNRSPPTRGCGRRDACRGTSVSADAALDAATSSE